VLRREEE